MGTHPIFESDFDCLTGSRTAEDSVPAKERGATGQAQEAKRNGPESRCSSCTQIQLRRKFIVIFYIHLYVCKTQMGDLKTYKMHFESKHSKLPLPEELKQCIAEGRC